MITQKKTLNNWLQEYNLDSKQNYTINNFLYFSNVKDILRTNLINGEVALHFLSYVDEWDEDKTYSQGDKVIYYTKKKIKQEKEEIEVIIDTNIYISNMDNNTGNIPSFDNRAFWVSISKLSLSKYISNDSINFAINLLKIKLPQVYGHIGTFFYEKTFAYQILGLFTLAYLYYYNINTTQNGAGKSDALITSKVYHNTSYTSIVPEYETLAGMEMFQNPFGKLMFNTLIDIIRQPYSRMV